LQLYPTAQALLEEVAATSARVLPVPGLGLATRDQVLPFQWAISVCKLAQPVVVHVLPTAQASLEEVAATPERGSLEPGSGLATRDHVVPFQCSISGTQVPVVVLQADPTAQALPAEEAQARWCTRTSPRSLLAGTYAELQPSSSLPAGRLASLAMRQIHRYDAKAGAEVGPAAERRAQYVPE